MAIRFGKVLSNKYLLLDDSNREVQFKEGETVLLIKSAAQQGVHLTAFGVCMLAFIAGFVTCWLVFVR